MPPPETPIFFLVLPLDLVRVMFWKIFSLLLPRLAGFAKGWVDASPSGVWAAIVLCVVVS
jgi:hypothetical protein